MLSVRLDGVELNDPNGRYGYWEIDKIENWWGAPEPKSQQVSRENSDGDFLMPVYYHARFPMITGAFVADGPGQRWRGSDVLSGLLSRGRALLSIGADGLTTSATVERSGATEVNLIGGTLIEYQIPVKAPDPYRYGESSAPSTTADAPLEVSHRGNANAWPVVTVTGSMPGGYEFSIGDRLLEVTVPLVAGKPHVINTRTRRITVGGVRTYAAFGYSDSLHIEPGLAQNFYALPKTTGTASFKVAYYDTYI